MKSYPYWYKDLLVPEYLKSRVVVMLNNNYDNNSIQSIYCECTKIVKKCGEIPCDMCMFECAPTTDPSIFTSWLKEAVEYPCEQCGKDHIIVERGVYHISNYVCSECIDELGGK